MSVTYEQAPEAEVGKMIAEIMHQHHRDLYGAGVTIEPFFARKYDKDEAPVAVFVVRGQVTGAKISITNLLERVSGHADAKLVIDKEYGWDRLAESTRIALIGQMLTRLQLVEDGEDGGYKVDDHGRPKLRMRHYDYEFGGFFSCIENYGEASIEAKQIRLFQEQNGQYCLFPTPASLEVKADSPKGGRPKKDQAAVSIE